VRASLLAAAVAAAVVAQQPPPPTQAQQRPVFRGGTQFVRVDAYPTRDGKIIEGLTADDFEILENGRPQKIETVDFIKFDTFTPEAVRHDPSSQREGFDLAADPRYRVFVIFVDPYFSNVSAATPIDADMRTGSNPFTGDIYRIQQPLVRFLQRILGPQDLYGFLTSRNSAKDLVLAQKSTVTEAEIRDLLRSSFIDLSDDTRQLDVCFGPAATEYKRRFHADAAYAALKSLVLQLGSLRQERKNVVFVSNMLLRDGPNTKLLPGPDVPRVGIKGGRIGTKDPRQPEGDESYCYSEAQRLAHIDFNDLYEQLLRDARKENVAFYPITPAGLQGGTTIQDVRAVQRANEDLRALAENTDGVAIVDTNNLDVGMRRIGDDLSAYYLLGYYTNNTKWDGTIRSIKVRLKSGGAIRARREYRAPTEAEMTALKSSSSATAAGATATGGVGELEAALAPLERASRPFAVYVAQNGNALNVVTELSATSIQLGRWKNGADLAVEAAASGGEVVASAKGRIEPGAYAAIVPLTVPANAAPARIAVRLRGDSESPGDDWLILIPHPSKLVADPIVYRAASRIATRPVAAFEFPRNERIKVEWPVLAALEKHEARLLDRHGKLIPVDLPLAEDAARHVLVTEMGLSSFGAGDYLIELTVVGSGTTDRKLLAFRVK
jgi:VWFA-related protein